MTRKRKTDRDGRIAQLIRVAATDAERIRETCRANNITLIDFFEGAAKAYMSAQEKTGDIPLVPTPKNVPFAVFTVRLYPETHARILALSERFGRSLGREMATALLFGVNHLEQGHGLPD
ncbi:hypothetical protein [Nisaea sediminum]|jgi:hypothetical protein|uniref:hypothetical protein n=2 Tax=Pseudomonadota TaxID=1224 RepID=UPI0018672D06|nr:hypothetical protein [Nisaea sediminum]